MAEAEELSDEQRLSVVEGKVGKNRMMLIIVVITMVVVLSVSLTLSIINLFSDDEPYVLRSSFEEQQVTIQLLSTKLEQHSSSLGSLTLDYQQSDVATFQQTMIEQEQSYQEFLSALKMGMFDLAKMVQGSRTWLDVYNEQLDDAKDLSKLREENLRGLK
jgi:flagellar basal body-associated protein FliL